MMKYIEIYKNGLDTKQFKHIPEISVYNNNYYIGFNNDLLFAKSDDDNTTEWFIVENEEFYYLGESYVNDGEILNRFENQQT